MSRSSKLLCLALALALTCIAADRSLAHADSNVGDPLAWSLTTMEFTMVPTWFYLWNRKKPLEGWRLTLHTLAPIGVSVGVGIASHAGEWNADIPRAAHGALVGGASGLILGGLVDGRLRRDVFHRGQWAYTLGVTAALAAGWAGATQVDAGEETGIWQGAPIVGMAGGAFVGGITTLILSLSGNEDTGLRILGVLAAAGAVGGLLLGSLGSSPDESPDSADDTRAPRAPARFMVSIPLAF